MFRKIRIKWKNLKYWWQHIKWPYVKRVKYELIKTDSLDARRHASLLKDELKIANEWTETILPRLVNIDVTDITKFHCYRACADFQKEMVERAFTHGGDDQYIKYMSKHIAHTIEKKMVCFNFGRCERIT